MTMQDIGNRSLDNQCHGFFEQGKRIKTTTLKEEVPIHKGRRLPKYSRCIQVGIRMHAQSMKTSND